MHRVINYIICVSIVVSFSFGLQGCSCTLMGCSSGLFLNFKIDRQLFGNQKVEYTINPKEEQKQTCSYIIDHNEDLYEHAITTSCGHTVLVTYTDGVILTRFLHFFPIELQLKVKSSSNEIYQGFFSINYKKVQPNGYRCEPVCKVAKLQIIIR